MKSFVVLCTLLGVAFGKPSGLLIPAAIPAFRSEILQTAPIQSQFHAQDALGQYSYGYSDGLSAKQEVKSFDGITRGSYSYIDAAGKLQTTDYTADAVNGFRVAATNLPKSPEPLAAPELKSPQPVVDTPEVAAARSAHLEAIEKAKSGAESPAPLPKAIPAENLPQQVEDTPEVAKAKAEHFEAKKQAELRNSAIQLSSIPVVRTVSALPEARVLPLSPFISSQTILPGGYAYRSTQWNSPIYGSYYY